MACKRISNTSTHSHIQKFSTFRTTLSTVRSKQASVGKSFVIYLHTFGVEVIEKELMLCLGPRLIPSSLQHLLKNVTLIQCMLYHNDNIGYTITNTHGSSDGLHMYIHIQLTRVSLYFNNLATICRCPLRTACMRHVSSSTHKAHRLGFPYSTSAPTTCSHPSITATINTVLLSSRSVTST